MNKPCREGDKFSCGAIAGPGSKTVFIDGKSVNRLGDPVPPHECWAPSFITAPVSSTVFIDGLPMAIVGSMNTPHNCLLLVHTGVVLDNDSSIS